MPSKTKKLGPCQTTSNHQVFPCVFVSILYYMSGFNPGVGHFFYNMAIVVMVASIGQGIGLLASVSSPSMAVTLACIPVLLMPFAILGGLIVQTVPWWLHWLERISFYRLAFELAMVNEFKDVQLPPCPPLSLVPCPRSPDDIFMFFKVDPSPHNIRKNWLVLLAYTVTLRLLAYAVLALKVRINKRKRMAPI